MKPPPLNRNVKRFILHVEEPFFLSWQSPADIFLSRKLPGTIEPISLGMKQMGARSAGNPHATCDVAGAGNVHGRNVGPCGAPVLDPTCEP